MAEKTKEDTQNDESGKEVKKKRKIFGKIGFVKRFWSFQGLVVFFLGTIAFQGGVFLRYQYASGASKTVPNAEVGLGEFHFEADESEQDRISRAEFGLYIALLEQVDQDARHRLATHEFRVQQDIEELLRQAHSGDFDDPNLGELKRQLQEQINETLGMRAIADVIITDLSLELNDTEIAAPIAETADMVPWVEKPSS